MTTENINEYDDETYLRTSSEFRSAVYALWNAGASLDDIAEQLGGALTDSLDGPTVSVEIIEEA